MKPLLVSSGEPAGIGPDLCLALADLTVPLVVLGDKTMLAQRAKQLGLSLELEDYDEAGPLCTESNHLTVLSIPCAKRVTPGRLDPQNASYVMDILSVGVNKCLQGEFSGLITAPVHKAVINEAGFAFTGHTEFLAELCHVATVVMMLACQKMKVALVTTHLPLKEVADAINPMRIKAVISCLYHGLKHDFGIANPNIYVAGLNPHAGEGGYLGREEIEIITPALSELSEEGIHTNGPFPADTLFTPKYINMCDAFVAMYHDQGLPVLKNACFGQAVNVTLGLPIVRTSVDHGTAIELAGTGMAKKDSLFAAVEMARVMAVNKDRYRNFNHDPKEK
tara:strand:- start:867 stop:1874 length:1008 start_codon:yes stop_codon:yes gene_type:complete